MSSYQWDPPEGWEYEGTYPNPRDLDYALNPSKSDVPVGGAAGVSMVSDNALVIGMSTSGGAGGSRGGGSNALVIGANTSSGGATPNSRSKRRKVEVPPPPLGDALDLMETIVDTRPLLQTRDVKQRLRSAGADDPTADASICGMLTETRKLAEALALRLGSLRDAPLHVRLRAGDHATVSTDAAGMPILDFSSITTNRDGGGHELGGGARNALLELDQADESIAELPRQRHIIDSDDEDNELWSGSDEEAGDDSGDAADVDLPQDHSDLRRLRLEEKERARVIERRRDSLMGGGKKHKAGAAGDATAGKAVPTLDIDRRGRFGEADRIPAFGSEEWHNLEMHVGGRAWSKLPRAKINKDFVENTFKRSTIASNSDGWVQDASNTTSSLHIVGMWNPAEGTGYVQPAVKHDIDVIFIPDKEADMQRIVDEVQARVEREAALAGELTLAQIVDRGITENTTVDDAIKKQRRGELDIERELRDRAFLAARSNNLGTLEECVDDFGVDVNSKDSTGTTLLILACQQADTKIVKYLLRRKADINATNHSGNCCLHYCFEYNNQTLGEYLISKGADDSIVNGQGLTCYEGLNSGAVDDI